MCEIRIKNIKRMKRFLLVPLFTIIVCCNNQTKKADYVKISGDAQGTTYHITYENTVGRNLSQEVDTRLDNFNKIFSIYDTTSIISQINRNSYTSSLPPMFEDLINVSYKIYKESNGAFDITVGPLVRAWGFGPDTKKMPSKTTIDSLRKLVGMDKIKIKNGIFTKADAYIKIDVNGIAQGYSVDLISKFLDSLEIKNYMVEIGGELRAKGKNGKGKLWRIGIDKPVEGNDSPGEKLQAIINIENISVSTSGNYRKFYIENGVKYSHTIDPFTGYPAKNTLLSVTIVTDECAVADAVATACMVMGLEKSIAFLKQQPVLKAFLIYSDKEGNFCEYITENLKPTLSN